MELVWNKLGKSFYWNGLIRLFLELYQDLALLSFLNLYTAEWDSVYDSVRYSNNLSAVVFGIVLALPLILAIVMYRNRTLWNDPNFRNRFGALLDGTKGTCSAATVLLIFLLRRLTFVISVVAL